jgi:hypothetical protein
MIVHCTVDSVNDCQGPFIPHNAPAEQKQVVGSESTVTAVVRTDVAFKTQGYTPKTGIWVTL